MTLIQLGFLDDFRSGANWRFGVVLPWKRQTSQINSLRMFSLQGVSRWAKSSRTECYDDLTGFPLAADMVRRASEVLGRQLERVILVGCCQTLVRCVDITQRLFPSLEYWSRLVVAETKFRSTIDPQDKAAVFASTPPHEAVRAVLTCCDYRCSVLRVRDERRCGHDGSGYQSSTSACRNEADAPH